MKIGPGHVAVVTGAASGIGRATAGAFVARGAKVVLVDIEEGPLAEAVASLDAQGAEVLGVPADVAREADIVAVAERALSRFGAVHVLHNNAGVVVNGLVQDIPQDVWDWVVGVNFWSALYGIRAFLPVIEAQGEGHVVNTASTAGLQANARIGPYNVSKSALIALSETLRLELEARRSPVGVTVVCPGPVKTAIVGAERNRPASIAKEETEDERAFKADRAQNLLTVGLDTAPVAEQILDAVERGRFWVLTHPEWRDLMVQRAQSMGAELP